MSSGEWFPLTLNPGQVLVLVGHVLTIATAGALPAAGYRVVRVGGQEGGDGRTT